MPAPRPLSRSLVPLPGESLAGFLLRLSRRLGLPPAQLARLTGLTPAGHTGASLPVALLAGIPGPDCPAFAFMTRLAADEVVQLGMSAWQERYAPLVIGPEDTAPVRRRLNGQLILAPVTRYCPDCLAGDGSVIQESFGGPWLKAWHLPVAFACPAHRRLLEHLCPGCGHPVRGRRPGAEFSLLPATRVSGLHPAQCRTELVPGRGRHTLPDCCGARLDQAAGNRRPASPGLIALQYKILDLLDPGGPASTLSAGQPTQPPGYFADLQAIGLLACSTWPAARHLSPSGETASAIDEHVASLRRQAEGRQRVPASSASRVRFGFPPADAAASAGLAHIADRILAGSTDEVREQLRQLLPASIRKTGRTAWGSRVARSSPPCSDGLRDASGPLLRGFTRAGGRPEGRRNPVLRTQRWGPEHIPAFLPEDWYTRHFTPIDGVIPMFTRRTAVIRLVQMVAGGSLGEAAGFLGIASTDTTWESKGRIYTGAGSVHTGAKRQLDPLGFETALSGLARELDDPATPLVNYKHRRQALRTWCIDEDTWDRLIGRLPPVPGPQQPELGDRKRQIASVYVWVQVTSGEHCFAPRPIEAAQSPEIQEAWKERRNTIWHLMHRSRPSPHYGSLKAELNTIATALASSIDTRRI
jgi:TniQ protein